ncbi:MAG: ATP-binding protein [Chloroflexota bacterium]
MSLRLRLTLTYLALLALALAAFATFLYFTMQRQILDDIDRQLTLRSDEVQLALWPNPQAPTLADLSPTKLDLSPLANLNAPSLYVQVVSLNRHVLATSSTLNGVALPIDQANFASVVAGKQAFNDVIAPGYPPIRVLSDPIIVKGKVGAILQVSQPLALLTQTLRGLRTLLLLLGLGVLAVAGGAGWFVAYHGLRPLGAMSRQAAGIAAQRNFSRRLGTGSRPDEVGQLARTINQLLATVDETLSRHRDFVADTSHELRNPLLAIRTNLELMDRVPDAAGREECVRESRQQVERMSRLVSDLLLLAQVEAGLVVERRPVELASLVTATIHELEAPAGGPSVTAERLDAVRVLGDEGRLRQILTNLLSNALKHTPPSGHITVRVEEQPRGALLTVQDTGEGIAAEDLPNVFERGFRAKSGGGGSYGLGLAIVKHLAEAHGGNVAVQSELGAGSCFSVWLPSGTRHLTLT